MTVLTEMESKLRPCPFCGATSLSFFGSVNDTHGTAIRCDNCRASVWHNEGGDARNVWSRRADEPQPLAVCPSCGREKLKGIANDLLECSACNHKWEGGDGGD